MKKWEPVALALLAAWLIWKVNEQRLSAQGIAAELARRFEALKK